MRTERVYRRVLQTVLNLLLCAFPLPSIAAPTVPAEQSKCEIKANRYKARHPNADLFHNLALGFFPFGRSIPPKPPWSYVEPRSGISFLVEKDGRHLVAVDRVGKLLWERNPFVDGNMCPYRSAHPFIWGIGPADRADSLIVKELNNEIAHGRRIVPPGPRDHFISLSFDSSQFGWENATNGDFYEMGQN